MSALLRTAQQVVIVERRQFALCDGAAPNGDGPWQLPDRDVNDGLSVNNAGVMVASTVPMHDVDVQIELWNGEPSRVGEKPIGEVLLRLPSGTLTAWAVPHGPAGEPLEMDGIGVYSVRVYRRGGGEEAITRQKQGIFSDLESYVVQAWRRP
ncbi:hypothetical protein ABZ646_37410 [Streptomyces sp. NPDC007162]|uniref:hypothetical protein n=1 Tax=Streptomyces sp. NPDC007162 TaxID=3156917 RepID=UPI0033DF859E